MQSRCIELPVYEPFALDELKDALRVTHDLQDDLIWTLGKSARKLCEDAARICISPQRWVTVYRAPMRSGDEFGLTDNIADPERILHRLVLPRPPVQAIMSVTLVHRNGSDRVILNDAVDGSDGYFFDRNWGAITWTHEAQRLLTNPYFPTLEVEYTCGYPILNPGAELPLVPDRTVRQVEVEDSIREAIFVTTANGFDDPSASTSKVPQRAIEILRPYWNQPRYAG